MIPFFRAPVVISHLIFGFGLGFFGGFLQDFHSRLHANPHSNPNEIQGETPSLLNDPLSNFLHPFFNASHSLEIIRPHFSSSFLQQIPLETLIQIQKQLMEDLGEFSNFEKGGDLIRLKFKKGECTARISFDFNGKVQGLWFGTPKFLSDNIENIASEFKTLSGKKGVSVFKGLKKVFSYQGETPLSVASAFKLYILKEFLEGKKSGHLQGREIVPIEEKWRSYPVGFLKDWPAQTPLTVDSLACLMISLSDNTATDLLLFFLGREKIEKWAPASLIPLLSTREFFSLKFGPPSLLDSYLSGTLAEKRARLLELENEKKIEHFPEGPYQIEKWGWVATTDQLCQIIHSMEKPRELSINPGIIESTSWNYVGFKGGSEPGVLNFTYSLQKGMGSDTYSLSATWNDPDRELDQRSLILLVTRIISLIEKGEI